MKENWWQDSGGGRNDPQPDLVEEEYAETGADVLFSTSSGSVKRRQTRLGVRTRRD